MAIDELKVKLNLDAEEFADGLKSAVRLIKKLDDAIETTDEGIKRNRNVIKAWAKSVRGSITEFYSLTQLVSPLANVITSVTTSFIEANAEFEKTIAVMGGLSSGASSVEQATANLNAEIARLEELAVTTPFTMQTLQASMVKLKAGGVQNLDFAMRALIDSVASFGGGSVELDRAAVAIQQMAGKGVVSMEELRQQLGEAVPNAMALMARGMNVSMGELAKLVESGTLEAQNALKAMFAQMALENAGASERMMGTWNGVMSQISTRINKIQREMGAAGLFDELKRQLQTFLDYLNDPATLEFFIEISKGITSAIQETVKFIKYVDDLNVAMDILRDIIAVIALKKFADNVGKVVSGIRAFGEGLDGVVTSLKGIGTPLKTMRTELDKQNKLTQASLEMWGFYNSTLIKSTARIKKQQIVLRGLTSTLSNIGSLLSVMGKRMLALAGPIGIAVSVVVELADAFGFLGDEVENVREKAMQASSAISPDEYNLLANSVNEASDKVKKLNTELAEQKKIQEESARGSSQYNRAGMKSASIQAAIGDTTKAITEGGKALEKQTRLLAARAVSNFNSEFTLEFGKSAAQIKLDFQRSMNDITELRNNPGALSGNELQSRLDEMQREAVNRQLETYSEQARAAADAVYLAQKTQIEETAIEGKGQQERLDALKRAYDTRLAEIKKRELELTTQIGEIRKQGIVTLKGTNNFWDKAYRNAFVELSAWRARLNGQNVAYAKSLAKQNLEQKKDVVFTQAQTEELTTKTTAIKAIISANKELASTDSNIAKEQSKIAASQVRVSETNPWLVVSAQQKKYLQSVSQSEARVAEFTRLFGKNSEAVQRATGQVKEYQALLSQQEGIDLTKMTRAMDEQTQKLQQQVMTESQLSEVRRADYNKQQGYIQTLINDVDNISVKTGLSKQALLDTFTSYSNALEQNFVAKNRTAMENVLVSWGEMTKAMDQSWANTFSNLSSSLADFVMTGKLDFESLTQSIMKNMLQIAIQAAASSVFGGFFGGATGAAASGGSAIAGFAKGGIASANSPQVAVFGEGSMNEAFVPLPDGRAIPVNMNGQNQTPNVSINVINETGQAATAEQGDLKFNGEQWVLDVVMKAMNQPGQFRSAMKGGTRQ